MPPANSPKHRQVSGLDLKLIGLAAMLIDHSAHYLSALLPPAFVVAAHLIGRLAIPIFCFSLAVGMRHTRSRAQYLARLFGMACVVLAGNLLLWRISGQGRVEQNIFFSLGVTGLLITALDHFPKDRALYGVAICGLACLSLVLEGTFSIPILTLAWYLPRGAETRIKAFLAGCCAIAAVMLLQSLTGPVDPTAAIQPTAVLALPLLTRYSGRSGRSAHPVLAKYGFYAIYPLHLWLLYAIRGALG